MRDQSRTINTSNCSPKTSCRSQNEKIYDSASMCILRAVQSKNVRSHDLNVSGARYFNVTRESLTHAPSVPTKGSLTRSPIFSATVFWTRIPAARTKSLRLDFGRASLKRRLAVDISRVALRARGSLVGTSSRVLGPSGRTIVQRPARAFECGNLRFWVRASGRCGLKIIARGTVYLAWSPETST